MEETIINADILPEILCRHIRSEKVKVRESNGIISLIPFETTAQSETPITDSLIGLLANTGIKSMEDIKNMRLGL